MIGFWRKMWAEQSLFKFSIRRRKYTSHQITIPTADNYGKVGHRRDVEDKDAMKAEGGCL
jgi:hypothetical protein